MSVTVLVREKEIYSEVVRSPLSTSPTTVNKIGLGFSQGRLQTSVSCSTKEKDAILEKARRSRCTLNRRRKISIIAHY